MSNFSIGASQVALGHQQVRADVAKEGAPLEQTPQAPMRLTPMRRATDIENQAVQKEQKSGSVFSKVARNAKDALASIRKNQIAAKAVGVDATKVGFLRKVFRAGAALAGLVGAGLVAQATSGASLIAAAVMTGVVCLISGADARCAYMNHKNAAARDRGETPPHELPMGDSSLGNLLHKLFTVFGVRHERAKTLAAFADKTIRVSLQVATAMCTGGMSLASDSIEHIAPVVGGALDIVRSVGSSSNTDSTAIGDGLAAMHKAVETLPGSESAELLADLKDIKEKSATPPPNENAAVNNKESHRPRAGALTTLAPETATAAVNAVGTPGYNGRMGPHEIRA